MTVSLENLFLKYILFNRWGKHQHAIRSACQRTAIQWYKQFGVQVKKEKTVFSQASWLHFSNICCISFLRRRKHKQLLAYSIQWIDQRSETKQIDWPTALKFFNQESLLFWAMKRHEWIIFRLCWLFFSFEYLLNNTSIWISSVEFLSCFKGSVMPIDSKIRVTGIKSIELCSSTASLHTDTSN